MLQEAVQKARGNRKKILAMINKTLQERLVKHQFPSCAVIGREKHLYSIYRKMRAKKIPFNEIMDVYAFRIIVDDVDTCYRVLGLVHQLFKPVPERFKDYIAIPKVNGYQSLHTTLFGPYGLPIEIQIRTTDMDRIAANGIAAHWLYKTEDKDLEKTHVQAQKWVNNLLELQKSSGSSLEFIENVKVDLFPDEVYTFTPKGDIKQLPAGATGVDFAYAVHTDIGNSCVAIKINRQLAPLSAKLSNGDTVEVVTSSNARPNPSWLDFVVMSKAKNGIRNFLKSQKQKSSVELGKKLLQKALRMHALTYKKIPDNVWHFFMKEAQLKSMDTLLIAIGLGHRAAAVVAERIDAIMKSHADFSATTEKVANEKTPLFIEGTEGMLLEFAACCHPIPGDPIVGLLKAGKGIIVHTEDCRAAASFIQDANCVPLRWSVKVDGEFPVVISVVVKNERGVLASLASALSDAGTNIDDIHVDDREGHFYKVTFNICVKNRMHLANVLRRLRQIQEVVRIIR